MDVECPKYGDHMAIIGMNPSPNDKRMIKECLRLCERIKIKHPEAEMHRQKDTKGYTIAIRSNLQSRSLSRVDPTPTAPGLILAIDGFQGAHLLDLQRHLGHGLASGKISEAWKLKLLTANEIHM